MKSDNKVYKNLLDTTADADDLIWKRFLPIYKEMSRQQQLAFLQFLRMIQVNTLSHVLGILDGTSNLMVNGDNFILKSEDSDELINGDLQDIFLGMEKE